MSNRRLTDPNTWVERHGDYLYRCALLRVRDQDVAEEPVQETFVAALQVRERFQGQSTERSWMVGMLKHKIIDPSVRICANK
jgi:RNA polymerase sigma-70 factor (ECF subfamily)